MDLVNQILYGGDIQDHLCHWAYDYQIPGNRGYNTQSLHTLSGEG